MNPNIIYGLIDPRTLMIRYVGQSKRGLKRTAIHARKSVLKAESHLHKARWINELQDLGLQYEHVILQMSSADSISDDERWWIAYGRACGWPLTNLTDGGEGVKGIPPWNKGRTGFLKHTAEAKAKIAAASTGRKRSPESIEKSRQASIGRIPSDETRARMSAAHLGQAISEERRKKTGDFHRGRKRSDLTVQRLRAAHNDPEVVAKKRAAHLGKKRSEETRQRLRDAWIRRRARSQEGTS